MVEFPLGEVVADPCSFFPSLLYSGILGVSWVHEPESSWREGKDGINNLLRFWFSHMDKTVPRRRRDVLKCGLDTEWAFVSTKRSQSFSFLKHFRFGTIPTAFSCAEISLHVTLKAERRKKSTGKPKVPKNSKLPDGWYLELVHKSEAQWDSGVEIRTKWFYSSVFTRTFINQSCLILLVRDLGLGVWLQGKVSEVRLWKDQKPAPIGRYKHFRLSRRSCRSTPYSVYNSHHQDLTDLGSGIPTNNL